MNNELSNHNKVIETLELLTVEPDGDAMARLDADELDAVLYAIRALRANPPAELLNKVVKVTRGGISGIKENRYVCTNCGFYNLWRVTYCPNCGAKITRTKEV